MPGKPDLNLNVEGLTDAEISAAIRYLDPDPSRKTSGGESDTVLVICVSFIVVLVGALAYLWHYLHAF